MELQTRETSGTITGDFDVFLVALWQKNWHKLTEPMNKLDTETVYEFYANAWGVRQRREERKSRVRGKWIYYHPKAINDFLGNPYPNQEELCTYLRMKSNPHKFDSNTVAYTLCIPDHTFHRGPRGQPKRIQRKDMCTLAQVWLTFMLANITPSEHVSDLNMQHYNLLFTLTQDEMTVNVTRVIFDEIQKFLDMEINQLKGRRRGALGFPALITALCKAQGVVVDVKAKIRPPINKSYIEKNYTNPDEHPEAIKQPPLKPAIPPSPRKKEMESHLMKNLWHIQKHQTSNHRALLQIFQGLYILSPQAIPTLGCTLNISLNILIGMWTGHIL